MSEGIEKIVLFGLAIFFTSIIFSLDLYADSSYSVANLYTLIILYTWLLPGKSSVVISSTVCTFLIFYVAIHKAESDNEQAEIANAFFSTLAVWVAMFLTLISRRGYNELNLTIKSLDDVITKRTKALRTKLIDTEVQNRLIETKNSKILALNKNLERESRRVVKSRKRFQKLLKEAPTGILIINEEGIILDANQFTSSRLKNDHDLLQRPFVSFVHPAEQQKFQDYLSSFLDGPDSAENDSIELRLNKSNDTSFYAEVTLAQLEQDSKSEIIVTLFDLSERKAREEIKIRAAAIEVKNREIEHMAYLASHDLQEPLKSIVGLVNLLEEHVNLDEEGKTYITYIKSASERMGGLIKYLLNYSKLGTSEKIENVDIEKIVDEVKLDLQFLIKNKKAEIFVEKLPPVKNGSPFELRVLLQNLIANALKFVVPGVPPKITVGHKVLDSTLYYFVSDNGIGIDKEDQQKIFRMFKRLHNKAEYEGTGIGLAFSKKIVESHQGTIFLESAKGDGTTFYFSLNENMRSAFFTEGEKSTLTP